MPLRKTAPPQARQGTVTAPTRLLGPQYDVAIAAMFSCATIQRLASGQRCPVFATVWRSAFAKKTLSPNLTVGQFFDRCYEHLMQHYPSEYFYKNVIASELLLARHQVSEARFFVEFRVGKSRADVVVLNGTSTAYEIKSPLDDFTRLPEQLMSYRSVFDHTYVVTSLPKAQSLLASPDIGDEIGLIAVSDRGAISLVRESSSNAFGVEPATIFDSLRQPEYMWAVSQAVGYGPIVPNGVRYQVYKDLFSSLSPELAHGLFVKSLHRRKLSNGAEAFVEKAPVSLRALALDAVLRGRDLEDFSNLLSQPVRRSASI